MHNEINIDAWHDTKKRLVDAGVTLIRARGFNATSLDDICAAAGVTKGGFFHYFNSKDDLAKAAIARFNQGKIHEYENAPFRKHADPLDRVFGRLDFVKSSIGAPNKMTKGCLIGMLAQELSSTNPELRQACEQTFATIAADFEKDLAEAKATYAPKATFNPKNIAHFYVTMVQGSLLLAKANQNTAVLSDNISEFRHYLETLFGEKRPKISTRASKALRNPVRL
ncbi:MAG TPA: TetR/AcrR family transcriptional regulator [Verrucomicrobiae bacterium]|jgi:TetR/AcrR family transcriptional repressor of nem operon